jgi:hypothetical protein
MKLLLSWKDLLDLCHSIFPKKISEFPGIKEKLYTPQLTIFHSMQNKWMRTPVQRY